MMTDGNNFSDMLTNVRGNCPNCGTTLTFMESAQLAKNNDISEDAVMCHKCRKVYTVNITLDEMKFVKDITPNNNEDKNTKVEYAEIFKEAIDEENLEKAQSILDKWLVDSPDDANMFYATIIVRSLIGKGSTDSLNIIFNSASKVKAVDTNLEDWYIEKASNLIEIQKLKDNKSNQNGNDEVKTEIHSQNDIIRPNHQHDFEQKLNPESNVTQEIPKNQMIKPIQQPDNQQQIPQQQVTDNNYNQSVQKTEVYLEFYSINETKKHKKLEYPRQKQFQY